MTVKYHFSPKTGRVGECKAKEKPCRYGEDSPHFSSPEDAQQAYENKMKGETFATLTVEEPEEVVIPLEDLEPETDDLLDEDLDDETSFSDWFNENEDEDDELDDYWNEDDREYEKNHRPKAYSWDD